jgi:hypothetical protein
MSVSFSPDPTVTVRPNKGTPEARAEPRRIVPGFEGEYTHASGIESGSQLMEPPALTSILNNTQLAQATAFWDLLSGRARCRDKRIAAEQ